MLQKSLRLLGIVFCFIAIAFVSGLTLVWNNPGFVVETISKPVSYAPAPVNNLDMTCFSKEKPVSWQYCINQIPTSSSQTLIYHFHGRRGNETWWNDDTYYTGNLYREWTKQNVDPPTVVSISFGSLWLLEKNGLLDVFLNEVMPEIESNLDLQFNRRLVVGESMGGVNAVLAWLNSEGVFDGVASLCPPLPTISSTASLSEIMDYMSESETTWQRGAMLLFMGRYFFPTHEEWSENSPLELARNNDLSELGPMYLSCGEKDDWGCMIGSRKLVEITKAAGVDTNWHPMPGGHCDIDEASLSQFLVSLETDL